MQVARILGNNCKMLLNEKGISKEEFAEQLGYSYFDVEKLCDGRLYTTEEDIRDIATFFEVTTEELCMEQDGDRYKGVGFMHCMGQFKKKENREKILDILDMYCDLKEVLNK